MERPQSMDVDLQVQRFPALGGLGSKTYCANQRMTKMPGFPPFSPPLLPFLVLSSSLPPPMQKIRDFSASLQRAARPTPVLLLWQLPRGLVPRPPAIWGEHPAGHPEEHHFRDTAGPSQARAAVATRPRGVEAGWRSVPACPARHLQPAKS